MKKSIKKIISFILVVCLICAINTSVFADNQEEYLADLRIIYADSYNDAVDSLKGGDFEDYKVLNTNLNEGSGETAVWLAYKTTTDIEDAITDVAAIQMDGGYNEGNYQEMIKKSMDAYTETSEVYLQAVDYFIEAYNAGDYMAESAFRQLNFYSDNVDHDGETLGNLFEEGLEAPELAKIFMQGNRNALSNIRTLLAMGVSYNEDGKHYLEHVEEAAALYTENSAAFESEEDFEEYEAYAALISTTIAMFRDMFEELAAVEDEIDITDEEITETEFNYIEHYSLAERMRAVKYLNGQTLYDFCLNYEIDEDNLSVLYPLVYALNDGQVAMTRVAHYYSVVRYSIADMPEYVLEEQLAKAEEMYADSPFDIYTGVDMSIYEGTYALTSDAYRADALTEEGFYGYLFEQNKVSTGIMIGLGAVGVASVAWAVIRTLTTDPSTGTATSGVSLEELQLSWLHYYQRFQSDLGGLPAGGFTPSGTAISSVVLNNEGVYVNVDTCLEWSNQIMDKYIPNELIPPELFYDRMVAIEKIPNLSAEDLAALKEVQATVNKALQPVSMKQTNAEYAVQVAATTTNTGLGLLTGSLYIFGGVTMLLSAISLGVSRYNYYHPDYDDIPVAMVDLVSTVDGDRYIKYDAVFEAEPQKDGTYSPADTNAFAGQRWNALYYTKSYEAGKPLLAEIVVSFDNNTPEKEYSPVRRFGEVVSYNLNKYCFESEAKTIYLSIKQSKNNKSAVTDVPEVVGSVFSETTYIITAAIGLVAGVVLSFGVQKAMNKKKNDASQKPASNE